MSSNARVVLALLVLVGGVAFFAFYATQDPPAIPDGPSERGEESVIAPPPVPEGRPGLLTGEVRVFRTGEPAADIEVRIEGAEKPIVKKTNARGMFAAKVPSGPAVTVTVIAPKPYADVVISGVNVEADETTSLGTLYLERALLVKGIVVDRAGTPVGGAVVKAFRPLVEDSPAADFLKAFTDMTKPRTPVDDTTADGNGRFELRKLSPGTYRLEAFAEGFAMGSVGNVVVSPEAERIEHRIILGPGSRLEGTVTTAEGVPVEGALVSVLRFSMGGRGRGFEFSPVQTETDEKGEFLFAHIAPGQVSLSVRADGFPTKTENNVQAGQRSRIDIILGGTATVLGRVTSADGEPIEGAAINIAIGMRGGAIGETVTDSDGRYRLANMPEGRIGFLRVEARGYVQHPVITNPMMFQRGFGELKAGKVLTKDFKLSQGARVFGRITGKADGQPIEGAAVYVMSGFSAFLGANGQATTDENGEYSVTGIGEGLYQLRVQASGYYQAGIDPRFMQRAMGFGGGATPEGAPEVKLAEGGPDQRLDVALLSGATAVGTVLAPDNSPVPGARVTIVPPPSAGGMFMAGGMQSRRAPTAITDENGAFRLIGLEAGEAVKLEAEADTWVRGESQPVALQSGQETAGIVVRLRTGGKVTGTITSYEGSALAGAEIRLMPQPPNARGAGFQWEFQLRSVVPVLTNQEGKFEVTNLPPGPHLFRVQAPGHRTVTKFDIEVPEGADGGPVDVKLEKGLQIAGVVVDPAGEPVADVNVWTNVVMNGPRGGASNTSFRNAQTGEDGTFLLDSMEPGVYSLTVRASGYADRTIPDINAGTGDLRVVLEKGKSITGRVLLPDGRPAPNVWVTAQGDASGNDRTNEKGEFELPNLPDGSYTVRANTARAFGMGSGNSGEPSVMPAEQEGITAGTQNLELTLRAGAELTGTVRDATGNPVAMANVFAREQEGGNSTGFGRTDENGRFRLTGLEPGRSFSISVNHSDFTPAAPKVVTADTTGIEFTLTPRPLEPDNPDGTDIQEPR